MKNEKLLELIEVASVFATSLIILLILWRLL